MTETQRCESLAEETPERRLLRNFGYFGHYLHINAGGRNGKQHILSKLYMNGGHMTQSDLQKQSCVSSASLSEVIAKLEAEGLIVRTRSESDKRQFNIELTDAGIPKAEEIVDGKLRFEDEAFSCFSATELDQLLELSDRVAKHWNDLEARNREEA